MSDRYAKYMEGVQKILPELKEQIKASQENLIRVKLEDIAEQCGMKMKKVVNGEIDKKSPGLYPTSLQWGFKYALYHAGYAFRIGKVDDGQPVLIIWEIDKSPCILPESLKEATDK